MRYRTFLAGLAAWALVALVAFAGYSAFASRAPVLGDTCKTEPLDKYDDFEWDRVLGACRNAVQRFGANKTSKIRAFERVLEFERSASLALLGDKSAAERTYRVAQGGMMPGPGTVHSAGGTPASFTKEQNVGNTGPQAVSPYVIVGATFNTSASEVPVIAVLNANDFSSGVITGVSIVGLGATTCVQGTNNAAEQTWLCYGAASLLTTANISIAFTGTLLGIVMTGKVATTTPTPASTAASPGSLAGTTTPAAFQSSGGVPSSGVEVCAGGDFFQGARTITGITPTQEYIQLEANGNGQSLGLGSTTVAGGGSGVTFTTSPTSAFFSWACASWSP